MAFGALSSNALAVTTHDARLPASAQCFVKFLQHLAAPASGLLLLLYLVIYV